MRHDQAPHLVGYVDGSYTQLAAGGGYVARYGDRLVVGGYPLHGMTGANEAEAYAALRLVEMATAFPVPPSYIDIRTDSRALIHKWTCREDVHTSNVSRMYDLCDQAGSMLSLDFCKGHCPPGSAAGFLNHCGDRLAVLGAAGNEMSWDVPFDAFWRMHVMECHEDLRCEWIGLTRRESAGYLGVAPDVVDRLFRNGHLVDVPGRSLINAESLIRVRRLIVEQGNEIPLRTIPLRPMLGRIDEGESGFGGQDRARCHVRAVLHHATFEDRTDAIVSLEGPEGDEMIAALLPVTEGPHWEAALEGVVRLVDDRYPQCDRLTVVSPDWGVVNALNGQGDWSGLPVLEDLDGRVRRSEMTVEARPVPALWRAWQVSYPAAMLPSLSRFGMTGSWRVSPNPDPQRAPVIKASSYEPPWVREALSEAPGHRI